MGIGIATIVRILLFLAVLGVVVKGVALTLPTRQRMHSERVREIGYR